MTTRTEIAVEAAKAAPPVAVVASNQVMGIDIPTAVGIATFLYIVLQAAYLIWRWWHAAQDRQDRRKRDVPVEFDRRRKRDVPGDEMEFRFLKPGSTECDRRKQDGAANKTIVASMLAAGTLALASPMLMDFLGRWEGRENTAYADPLAAGEPTVCAGLTNHTSPELVVVGDYWSDAECERIERLVVGGTQITLADCLTVPISQQTFDALSSHAHNFGYPQTCASRAVGLINAGRLAEGCEALAHRPDGKTPVWSYVGKKFVRGLYNRRKAERDLCLSGTV